MNENIVCICKLKNVLERKSISNNSLIAIFESHCSRELTSTTFMFTVSIHCMIYFLLAIKCS